MAPSPQECQGRDVCGAPQRANLHDIVTVAGAIAAHRRSHVASGGGLFTVLTGAVVFVVGAQCVCYSCSVAAHGGNAMAGIQMAAA